MKTAALSLRLANDLPPGTHRLSNRDLRDHFGLSRVTAKAREEIAYELERLGLEVLSDPDHEPLVVRKTARVAGARSRGGARTPWWRRRWAIGVGVVVLLLMIVGALGDSETSRSGDDRKTTAAAPPTTEAPAEEPPVTLEDAAVAVDGGDYAAALDLAADLSSGERDRIRRKISRHLAKRARAALRRGDRSRARTLLGRSASFPPTAESDDVRAELRAADELAAHRAEQRRLRRAAAREAAREAAAAERAAAEEAAAAAAAEYDVPDADAGGSTTNWCGKRDGDGDGIYCED